MLTTEIQQHRFPIQNGATSLASVLAVASPTAPLLVFAHGFAGNKDENGLFSEASDYFVDRGFSVLRFDFRACGENKGAFKAVRLPDLVADLRNVFAYIESTPSLQWLPIGFVGFSLGAGIGLLAELRVQAYVFWSPAIYTRTDMVPRYQAEVKEKGYVIKGDIEVSKDFIGDLSSDIIADRLRGITAPVLLIHGTADQRIPYSSTERAFKTLRKKSKDCRISVISGADHSFRNNVRARRQLFSTSLEWLQRKLPRTVQDHSGQWHNGTHGSLSQPQHDSAEVLI
jgi:pimeloyl-ACP methyl ester carboxylesterase